MGTQVACTYNQSKQDMVVSVVAAGALVPGAGELVLWVGDNPFNQVEIASALGAAYDKLQEAGMPANAAVTSGSGQVSLGRPDFVFAEGAATPALTEDDAAVFYDQAFTNLPHNSELVKGMFVKASELLFESTYKVA